MLAVSEPSELAELALEPGEDATLELLIALLLEDTGSTLAVLELTDELIELLELSSALELLIALDELDVTTDDRLLDTALETCTALDEWLELIELATGETTAELLEPPLPPPPPPQAVIIPVRLITKRRDDKDIQTSLWLFCPYPTPPKKPVTGYSTYFCIFGPSNKNGAEAPFLPALELAPQSLFYHFPLPARA